MCLNVDSSTKKIFSEVPPRCIFSSTNMVLQEGDVTSRATFLKKVLPTSTLSKMALLIKDYPELFEWKKDNARGPKKFLIKGEWNAQGHSRPTDKAYNAGVASELMLKETDKYRELEELVAQISVYANSYLRLFRPDLCCILDVQKFRSVYGYFHLFMIPQGTAYMHNDRNDVVAFLFLISIPDDSYGGLELGGTGHYCSWKVGDCVLLDSSKVYHGTRNFIGNVNERFVGIFILHSTFLSMKSICYKKQFRVTCRVHNECTQRIFDPS